MADRKRVSSSGSAQLRRYFLRWRILARMRRFLRPILRRPLPVFFVPTDYAPIHHIVHVRNGCGTQQTTTEGAGPASPLPGAEILVRLPF